MSIHYHETEFDCFFDRFFATIEIEFEFHEGEKMVRYYLDGSGYPGSDPSVSIISAKVTSLSNESWDKTLEELEESGFAKWLNEAALVAAEEEISHADSWLSDSLLEEACSGDYED